MIEGFEPVPITRLGSLVTRYPAETLPVGVASEAVNVRFGGKSIETREGLDPTYGLAPAPTQKRITGLSHWNNLPLIWTSDGHLYVEESAGAQALQEILREDLTVLTALPNTYMHTAHAYTRTYIALADAALQLGGAAPMFYDGTYLDPVGLPIQTNGILTAQSAAAGNIDAGLRYCTFFFRTRSGFIQGFTTPAAIVPVNLDGNHQVQITFPAIGIPPNVTDVIVAFTLAGATQNGDFFYVGEADTVETTPISSMVVPITGGAMPPPTSFNFNDAFLVGATNVTANQNKITFPQFSNVGFLKSLQRFCWVGDPAQPDVFYFTEPNDPETILGTTGLVIPQQNGERAIGACELDNGEIILLKQRSSWMVLPTSDSPSTWEVRARWTGHGPCGPRAFDVYQNTLAYAHRSGAWFSDGGAPPTLLSFEIEENNSGFASPSWDGINWAAETQIWCMIDGISQEIRFGVPYGSSTIPNVIFKCFYGDGMYASVQDSPNGVMVVEGRKWSVDYITAHSMLRIYRNLPTSPNPGMVVDTRIATTQILVASALYDGLVSILNPSCKTDFNRLINVRYRTTMTSMFAVNKLGGVEVQARGNGKLLIYAFTSRSDPPFLLPDADLIDATDDYSLYCDENGFRFGLLLTNSQNDGDWLQIHNLVMYLGRSWDTPQ